jgi:hypothetical protein
MEKVLAVGIAYYPQEDISATMFDWSNYAVDIALEEIRTALRYRGKPSDIKATDLRFFKLGDEMKPQTKLRFVGFE